MLTGRQPSQGTRDRARAGARLKTRRVARKVAWALSVPSIALTVMFGMPAPSARADEVRDQQLPALQSLGVLQAHQQTKGKGVTVAVVDSGVDARHPDLAGSVVTGPDYTKGANPPGVPPARVHGTFMASLAAGHGHGPGRGNGVIGVAPEARILSIRVAPEKEEPGFRAFNTQRRFRNAVAKGIRHAADKGADVINLSLGKSSATPQERAAVTHAINRGAVVVAAVGNDGDSNLVDADGFAPFSYPAALPGVVAVAAVDVNKRPARFSNRNASVLVAATGVEVVGAGPGRRYLVGDGTSQATAMVSGVAALIRSKHPKLAPALVSQAIVAGAVDGPSAGYDAEIGFGTVNASRALAEAGKLAKYKPKAGAPAAERLGGERAAEPIPVFDRDPLWLGGYVGTAGFALIGFIASALVLIMVNRKRSSSLAAAPAPASAPVSYGSDSYGADSYGGYSYGGDPPGHDSFGGDPYGRPGPSDPRPRGREGHSGQPPYGGEPNGHGAYGHEPNGHGAYGHEPNGHGAYGHEPNGWQSYGTESHGRDPYGRETPRY